MSIEYGDINFPKFVPTEQPSPCPHEPKLARGLCGKCYRVKYKSPSFTPWSTKRGAIQVLTTNGIGNTKATRLYLISLLGGRCADPDCAWVNEDGSRGCTDVRCLQIDH